RGDRIGERAGNIAGSQPRMRYVVSAAVAWSGTEPLPERSRLLGVCGGWPRLLLLERRRLVHRPLQIRRQSRGSTVRAGLAGRVSLVPAAGADPHLSSALSA